MIVYDYCILKDFLVISCCSRFVCYIFFGIMDFVNYYFLFINNKEIRCFSCIEK